MRNIKNIVISGKISEDERERAEIARELLYKKGELVRNTTSCLIQKALEMIVEETSEGKKEEREKELEKMGGKLRTKDNEIGKLETENETLKAENEKMKENEKKYVEIIKQDRETIRKNESTIATLSIHNANRISENMDLMIENANLRQKFQNEQPFWKTKEFKELFFTHKAISLFRGR